MNFIYTTAAVVVASFTYEDAPPRLPALPLEPSLLPFEATAAPATAAFLPPDLPLPQRSPLHLPPSLTPQTRSAAVAGTSAVLGTLEGLPLPKER